ncbi:MAG TPA: hypothetical protein VN729_01520 [Ktedonobacteraceae bacterium]|nr:hypothetical protein [Ktedonobacteraceae bacterium]
MMDTSLEHVHEHEHEHAHGMEPHVKAARARAGILMLILSDALSVLAIFAAGGYLSALNTEGAFTATGDFAPALLPGILVAVGMALSGLLFYAWERTVHRGGKNGTTILFVLSWIILLAAGVGETWLGATLKYGTPISAYESVLLFITWSTAIHLLLTAVIGLLLFGRILNNRVRIDGLAFVPQVTGYWWYYTVIAGLLMWVFGVFFH